jgi:hypothetical protein
MAVLRIVAQCENKLRLIKQKNKDKNMIGRTSENIQSKNPSQIPLTP